jgi:Ca-activated chloride channel family protein
MFFFPGIFLIFSSCSDLHGKLKMVEGNFYASRDLNEAAIKSYEAARAQKKTKPYAEFAIASRYLAENQIALALELFDSAAAGITGTDAHRELAYRILYNKGIAYFQMENYQNAAASFRGALELDGRKLDGKRNLELALLVLEQKSRQADLLESEGGISSATEGAGDVLFDYIRKQEREHFQSSVWTTDGDDYDGPDL